MLGEGEGVCEGGRVSGGGATPPIEDGFLTGIRLIIRRKDVTSLYPC